MSFAYPFTVTKIHYCIQGFTKAGKYFYKNRKSYELGFRLYGESVAFAQGKTFAVEKNCVVFKPKGVDDVCQTESGTGYYSVWFDIEGELQLDFCVFRPENAERLLECFRSLCKEEKQHGVNFKCYSLLYEILHLLGQEGEYLSLRNRNILEQAVEYIEREYKNSRFCMNNILLELGISASFLRQLFHKKYGKSPWQYVIDKRMDYAKKLLLYSTYSVREISEFAGFESPFYFSRIFKKHMGISPAYYRMENEVLK